MYSQRYLVYNLRKRGGDSADKYFKATELIAGVKDMRFQALMPDVLHWFGIKKIDNMVSMSDMYVPLLAVIRSTCGLTLLVGNTTLSFSPAFPFTSAMIFPVRSLLDTCFPEWC